MARTQIDDELVRRLAVLLEETNLTEIEYEVGGLRLRVARAAAQAAVQIAPSPTIEAPAPMAHPPEHDAIDPGAVTSPMVGVAYLRPEPGAPAFVAVGDVVTEGDTLVLIEAMKTFNPIRAPRSGRVTRIIVGDGQPVEYGEPLVVIG